MPPCMHAFIHVRRAVRREGRAVRDGLGNQQPIRAGIVERLIMHRAVIMHSAMIGIPEQ